MANLAMKGGEPTIPGGLKTKWPIFDDADREALVAVLESGKWCSGGWYFDEPYESKVAQFEREFALWNGSKYAVTAVNGTAALVLALKAAGIGAGDEVIVPAVTFIASATAVILANAVPVFVDIEPDTYQMSPQATEAAISESTRAIMPVHYGGYPADMDQIMDIARRHDLLVVEDAAEAHGSEWRGKKVGTIGHLGCFSFQLGKPLAAGEGGAVLTDDEDLRLKCYSYGDLGRMPGMGKYEHYIPAGNQRMTEFQGALLLTQLSRLEAQTQARHENGEYFASELANIEGISALKRDPRITKRGYYFYFLQYDPSAWEGVPRGTFIQALRAEGVPWCSIAHNQPLYINPLFRDMAFGRTGCPVRCPHYGRQIDYSTVRCPTAERVYASEVIALSKDVLMTRDDVDRILEVILKIRQNVNELEDAGGS